MRDVYLLLLQMLSPKALEQLPSNKHIASLFQTQFGTTPVSTDLIPKCLKPCLKRCPHIT